MPATTTKLQLQIFKLQSTPLFMSMAPKTSSKKRPHPSSSSSSTIDYPEGKVIFKNNNHSNVYDLCLKQKEVVCSPTASHDYLERVRIKNEVVSLLKGAKLHTLAFPYEVNQYKTHTREFVPSFEEYTEDSGSGWKFQIGGKLYKKSKEFICGLCNFSVDEVTEDLFTIEERDAFWKDISDMDHYSSLMSPKNIKLGLWKYIHRLMSMNLSTRDGVLDDLVDAENKAREFRNDMRDFMEETRKNEADRRMRDNMIFSIPHLTHRLVRFRIHFPSSISIHCCGHRAASTIPERHHFRRFSLVSIDAISIFSYFELSLF